MTRQEASDYKSRFKYLLYEKGIQWALNLIDEKKVRNIAICEDYRKHSASMVGRFHQISSRQVRRICGCKK